MPFVFSRDSWKYGCFKNVYFSSAFFLPSISPPSPTLPSFLRLHTSLNHFESFFQPCTILTCPASVGLTLAAANKFSGFSRKAFMMGCIASRYAAWSAGAMKAFMVTTIPVGEEEIICISGDSASMFNVCFELLLITLLTVKI